MGYSEAGELAWCQTCCASGTSARLLEHDLIPKLGVFDTTQDFKRHLKRAIKSSHYETCAAHQMKALAAQAEKRSAEGKKQIALRVATIALHQILEARSYKSFPRAYSLQPQNLKFAVAVHPADSPHFFSRFFVMNIPTWFEEKQTEEWQRRAL